ALGLVDGLVDHMTGHLVLLRAVDQAPQGQVAVGVNTAGLGADIDLTSILAVDLGFRIGRFGHGFFAVLISASHRATPIKSEKGRFYASCPGLGRVFYPPPGIYSWNPDRCA